MSSSRDRRVQLPVVYDPDAWETDEDLDEEIPRQEIRTVREALIEVCRRHGSVSAEPLLSRAEIMADDEDYDRDVAFYLPGCWGDEKDIEIQPRVRALSEAWLSDLAAALTDLEEFPGWCVSVTLDEYNSLYLFADRILLTSELLSECDSASSIVGEIRRGQRCRDERLAAVRKLTATAYRKAVREDLELHLVAQYPTWSDGTPGKSVWLIHRNMTEDWQYQLDSLRFAPFASMVAFYPLHPDGQVSEEFPAEGEGVDLLVEWVLSTSDWRPSFFASPPSHPSGRFCGEAVSSARFLYVETKELAWRFELDVECLTRTCGNCGKRVPESFWHEEDAHCALCIADNWLDRQDIECDSCGRLYNWVFHSGFYDGAFFYCTRCPRRVLPSSYDPVVCAIRDGLDGKPSDDDEHRRLEEKAIEERLAPCPCGGAFEYEAPRRCVYCGAVIPDSSSKRNVWPIDDDSPFKPLEIEKNIWQ